MNSFSNIRQNTKTFDKGFKIKQNDTAVQQYNDQYKQQQDSLDIKTFEMTNDLGNDDKNGQIDYHTNANTQKEIVVQQNRVNLMADPKNIQMANILDENNPILRNGALSDKQRPMRVVEHVDNEACPPGSDIRNQIIQNKVNEDVKQAKVQAQKMKQHRAQNQFQPKPTDLSLSKRQDPDRAIIEQQINNNQKFSNDVTQFYGKQNGNDPMKRQFVIPNIGLQAQQNQVSDVQTRGENVFTTKPKPFRENINNRLPVGTNVITDINISRLISMPKSLTNFVQGYINPQLLQTQGTKARDNPQMMIQNKTNPIMYMINKITGTSNTERPTPQMQAQNSYIPQAVTRLTGGPNQVTGPTNLKENAVNHPQFSEASKMSNQAYNHGNWNGMFGEGVTY